MSDRHVSMLGSLGSEGQEKFGGRQIGVELFAGPAEKGTRAHAEKPGRRRLKSTGFSGRSQPAL